jgi:hypothetical protein
LIKARTRIAAAITEGANRASLYVSATSFIKVEVSGSALAMLDAIDHAI